MTEEELILNNLGLIYKVIKDLKCYWRTEDEFQDYYDAGLEGLIMGAKTYDGSSKPSTYLYPCIKNMIIREFVTSEQLKRRINKEIMVPLSEKISHESEDTYLDFIIDPNINIEAELLKKLETEKLINAINVCLTPLQKIYTCHYYGINGYKQMFLREIAEKYNCSCENVRQKVKASKKRLKMYLSKKKKDVFVKELKEDEGNEIEKMFYERLGVRWDNEKGS